ncbi:aminodeoxychorismate synthase component I [Sulfurospirillum arcachonense]|uniref:aminodeoxychorismate synthase component I n=1 Tax=Sulfurospirillum arcachonense TaxID=57666 RepID=UPI0004B09461|nr:aminodeoxychorismate synthase component I [Sulfurospirillum arcachonense]
MDIIEKLNEYGKKRKPLFFAIDFEMKNWILEDENVQFKLEKFRNYEHINLPKKSKISNKLHVSFQEYEKALNKVKEEIKKGNTYLLNLTFKTKLEGEIDLESIFHSANAPFKLHVKDKFVCFSPERFVKIEDNQISTYPMKGTIDASEENAKEKILANQKEMSEHTMVVDLLRNDLGIVAKNIQVEKFRYIEKINAGKKELLQVSSKITGDLDETWHESLGYILAKMLPAGSITGTPKKKTVQIINKIEDYERGFFTGVFGYYDGKSLDSAVMIRFIEKTEDGYIYKSGGGITLDSDALSEFEEMKDKVYIPS